MYNINVSQAGIIEEMMEDTLEMVGDDDELEEAAQEEVDKVLWELTAGKIHSTVVSNSVQ